MAPGRPIELAHHLDLVSPTQRTGLYKMFSAHGWRTREPGSEDLSPERPALTRDIACSLIERGLSADQIATIAGFAAASRNDLFRAGTLRAV